MGQENLEDYSIEELEVKKRICEDEIEEIKRYSIMHRISNKIGYDIYRILGIIIIIQIIVLFIVITYLMSPTMLNPSPEEAAAQAEGNMPLMMAVVLSIMPTVMLLGTDHTVPYQKRLKEINRVIRIKKDVYKQKEEQHSEVKNSNKEVVKLDDESDTLEYKRSFTENKIKVVRGVCGLLNQRGGILRIGVTDSKQVVGIEKDLSEYKNSFDKYQQAITNKIISHLTKTVADLIQIKQKLADGKLICDIEVEFSTEPIWLMENKEHQFWVRITNSTRELKGREENDYIRKHWKPKEEIKHKLQRFKEENQSNIKLVDSLIAGDAHYVPRDILERQLKKPEPEYLRYSKEDAQRIIDGGVYISKDNFSYDLTMQIIGIGHMLDDEFIKQVEGYIDTGKSLNQQKDFVQNWILSRRDQLPNPSEAHNYYTKLDTAKEKCQEMDKLINDQFKKIKK